MEGTRGDKDNQGEWGNTYFMAVFYMFEEKKVHLN